MDGKDGRHHLRHESHKHGKLPNKAKGTKMMTFGGVLKEEKKCTIFRSGKAGFISEALSIMVKGQLPGGIFKEEKGLKKIFPLGPR